MKSILKKTIYLLLVILTFIQLPVFSSCTQEIDNGSKKEPALFSAGIYESPFYCSHLPTHLMESNGKMLALRSTGDSLYICFKGQDYLYQSRKLYLSGILQTGRTKGFLRLTLNAFDKISEGKEGAAMILELEKSRNIFIVNDGFGHFKTEDARKAYANQIETDTSQLSVLQSVQRLRTNIKGGSGGVIYWSPAGTVMPTKSGGANSPTLDLAHEMFHGLDANRGLLDSRIHRGLARSEWQTVFRENILRVQLNLPMRTHYGWNVDVEGNFIGGAGRSMTSIENFPIIPSWYKL